MASIKPIDTQVQNVPLADALSDRYYAYAMSTIMSRSLPDVRDGLKPVHRRLLYAMQQLKLDPQGGYKKCARVVGDVIGKYHPHGDTAVYDTMVRLAQSFALRYPLVDGQGNFGSIDGDNAAAMRYTEARMTDVAIEMLRDLEQDTVDFRPTYDGSDEEPALLPARFPNLLANGSEGIAVGMATSIPPHNVAELCDALLHLIQKPTCEVAELIAYVRGPDFPTGGIIVEPQSTIQHAYETGRGAFRIRAKWEVEQLSHGQYQVIITEIPYQVQKSRLIEKIADLYRNKKLAFLGNIRDESAEDIRIVLEPKNRTIDPEKLMASLFKLTDLETRFNMNLNVLTSAGVPRVLSLKEVLQEYLDHRHEVLQRKSRYRLGQIDHRLEVLEGYLVAYLNLDEVIRIIREEDHPKQVLMETFKLTDVQAEAILNMRLRSLRKLEEMEIRGEHAKLSAEKAELQALLGDETLRWKHIAADVKDLKKQFGLDTPLGARRTLFGEAGEVIDLSVEAFVEKEPITILCSQKGWVRAVKGHQDAPAGHYKDGDGERFILKAQTTDKLLIFTTDGKFFTLGCDKIPKGKGHGEPLSLMLDTGSEEVVDLLVHDTAAQLLVVSHKGYAFRVPEVDVIAQTRSGKQVLTVGQDDKAAFLRRIVGDHVAVIGENRKLLIFPLEGVPEQKRGQGLRVQKYKDGGVSDITTFHKADGLSWKIGERTRNEQDITAWLGHRGQAGRLPPVGFPRDNRFG